MAVLLMTPPGKRGEEGQFEMVPLTSRVTRLFLGTQVQCCQCHDHPFQAALKQNHFWGVNAFLRGWAAYFRYGHSAQRLSKIRQYARMRLALFISKKHRRSRNFGWRVLLVSSPADLGLVSLYGITVAPRAGKPWRDKPNAGGERRR